MEGSFCLAIIHRSSNALPGCQQALWTTVTSFVCLIARCTSSLSRLARPCKAALLDCTRRPLPCKAMGYEATTVVANIITAAWGFIRGIAPHNVARRPYVRRKNQSPTS